MSDGILLTLTATVRPDGTLEFDQPIPLPPGRVRVTLQPTTRHLGDVIDEIHRSQLARGYAGRTMEEMAADEEAKRQEEDDYDRRMQSLYSPPLPPTEG